MRQAMVKFDTRELPRSARRRPWLRYRATAMSVGRSSGNTRMPIGYGEGVTPGHAESRARRDFMRQVAD